MDSDKPVPINKKKIVVSVFFVILGILLIAFLIFVPTKTITENIEVSYLDKETYYVQEAYDVQEPHEVQQAYTNQVAYQEQEPYEEIEYYTTYQNANPGKYFSSYGSNCVCSWWGGSSYCVQLICSNSKSVTKYRTVTKYRPVTAYRTVTTYTNITKYRDVPKVLEVTKTRIEQRPLEVNWILGYKTSYTFHLPFIS